MVFLSVIVTTTCTRSENICKNGGTCSKVWGGLTRWLGVSSVHVLTVFSGNIVSYRIANAITLMEDVLMENASVTIRIKEEFIVMTLIVILKIICVRITGNVML